MNKLIAVIVATIVFALLVIAYVEMGKKTAHEGKAYLETSREAVNRARESTDELNKRAVQTNKEVEKLFGGEKK